MSTTERIAPLVALGLGLLLSPLDGDGLRAALCVAGAAAILFGRSAPRLPALLLWAGLSCGVALGGPLRAVANDQLHVEAWAPAMLEDAWFAEVGYRDLWDQVLAADLTGGGQLRAHHQIRDLRTMRLEPSNPLGREPAPGWSPARWATFAEDVARWQDRHPAPKRWKRILRSGGHRASPLVRLLRPGSDGAPDAPRRRWLALLDLALFAGVFVFAIRARGAETAWLLAALILLGFGASAGLVGLPPTGALPAVLALAAALPDRPRTAGGAAAWLAGTALHLALLPVLLVALFVITDRPRLPRFAQGLAAVALVGLLAAAAGPRGPSAWTEWARAEHRLLTEDGRSSTRVGLPVLFHQPARAELGNRNAREAAWDARHTAAGAVGLLALLALAWRRRPALLAAAPLLLFPLPALAASLLAPLAVGGSRTLQAALLAPSLGFYALRGAIPGTFGDHVLASALLLAVLALAARPAAD